MKLMYIFLVDHRLMWKLSKPEISVISYHWGRRLRVGDDWHFRLTEFCTQIATVTVKVQLEKQKKAAEKRMREKPEDEMIEVEEADHKDLETIMRGINKDSVPEDMIIFWEQQQRILDSKCSKSYRWHPT